jgi:type III pantothenate kinase
MLLLVDAGNSRVKWALMERAVLGAAALGQWEASGSVEHEHVGQLTDAWRGRKIARAILTNVAGPSMRDRLEQILLRAIGVKPMPMEWLAASPALAGVRNCYREPQQLGSDRFASAIGGHALFPDRPLIIVTCGTATTIDAVAVDGVFTGGMILPGLQLMASSLAKKTAQLPAVLQQNEPLPPFADNTDGAIASGCMAAQAGAIERAFAGYARLNPGLSVQCIMSGGAAALVERHLEIPCTHVDNLVLIGLQTVALHQQSAGSVPGIR